MTTLRDTGVFGRRPTNERILSELTLVDVQVYPLPGAVFLRQKPRDPRLKTIVSSDPHLSIRDEDKLCFYEHIATIKHEPTKMLFVAFRETMDALLAKQNDVELFPEWLMKHPAKRTELSIYIYYVKCHPKSLQNIGNHEDWLGYIADDLLHDTLAFYLLNNSIITNEMYGDIRR